MGQSGSGIGNQIMLAEERRRRAIERNEEQARAQRNDVQGSLAAQTFLNRLLRAGAVRRGGGTGDIFGGMFDAIEDRLRSRSLLEPVEDSQAEMESTGVDREALNRGNGRQYEATIADNNYLGL